MPYIKKEDRERYEYIAYGLVKQWGLEKPSPGDLNYVLTTVCQMFMERSDKRYQDYNDVVGALEGAKLEFYRRQVATYENKKIEENGDL